MVQAAGDIRILPPSLVVLSKEHSSGITAYLKDKEKTVYIGEALIQLLSERFPGQSEEAIAYVLGHELAHYYRRHENFQRILRFATPRGGPNDPRLMQVTEREADEQGILLAHLAGFNAYQVAEQALQTIYTHPPFGLTDDFLSEQGYPTLSERIQIIQGVLQRMKARLPVLDVANTLALMSGYDTALLRIAEACYIYVLKDFSSADVYNNAGVVALRQAMSLGDSTSWFAYPVEEETNSRLFLIASQSVRSAADDTPEATSKSALRPSNAILAKEALLRAQKYFEKALQLSPDYVTAAVNLATTLHFLGFSSAVNPIEGLVKTGRAPENHPAILTFMGIQAFYQANYPLAQKYFETALGQESVNEAGSYAAYNLKAFQTLMDKTAARTALLPNPVSIEPIETGPLVMFQPNQVQIGGKSFAAAAQECQQDESIIIGPGLKLFICKLSAEVTSYTAQSPDMEVKVLSGSNTDLRLPGPKGALITHKSQPAKVVQSLQSNPQNLRKIQKRLYAHFNNPNLLTVFSDGELEKVSLLMKRSTSR